MEKNSASGPCAMPQQQPQTAGPDILPRMPATSGLRNSDPKNIPVSPASSPITEK